MKTLIALLAALSLLGCPSLHGCPLRAHEASRRYRNTDAGLSFLVPKGWHAARGEPAYVFNYPPSEPAPQGLLPENGAAVTIVPFKSFLRAHPTAKLDDWIKWNTRIKQRDIQRKNYPCLGGDGGTPHICAEVRSVFQITPHDPQLVRINYYFKVNGDFYRSQLEYYKGDPNAESYLSALKHITESIEPIGKRDDARR